jgi:hypothetical protein
VSPPSLPYAWVNNRTREPHRGDIAYFGRGVLTLVIDTIAYPEGVCEILVLAESGRISRFHVKSYHLVHPGCP